MKIFAVVGLPILVLLALFSCRHASEPNGGASVWFAPDSGLSPVPPGTPQAITRESDLDGGDLGWALETVVRQWGSVPDARARPFVRLGDKQFKTIAVGQCSTRPDKVRLCLISFGGVSDGRAYQYEVRVSDREYAKYSRGHHSFDVGAPAVQAGVVARLARHIASN